MSSPCFHQTQCSHPSVCRLCCELLTMSLQGLHVWTHLTLLHLISCWPTSFPPAPWNARRWFARHTMLPYCLPLFRIYLSAFSTQPLLLPPRALWVAQSKPPCYVRTYLCFLPYLTLHLLINSLKAETVKLDIYFWCLGIVSYNSQVLGLISSSKGTLISKDVTVSKKL